MDITQLLQYLQPDSAEAATPTSRPTQVGTSGAQALQQLKQVMELMRALQQQQANTAKTPEAKQSIISNALGGGAQSSGGQTMFMPGGNFISSGDSRGGAPSYAAPDEYNYDPKKGIQQLTKGNVTGSDILVRSINPQTGTKFFGNVAPDWATPEDAARINKLGEDRRNLAQSRQVTPESPASRGVNNAELVAAAQLSASLKQGGVPESIVKQIVTARFPTIQALEKESKKQEIRETKAPERENKLSDDFRAESKQFVTARDSFSRIQASAKQGTPAGDLSMIYAYMKMLDPGSVVRESEFRQAQTARPMVERMGLNWDALQAVWAGQKMTPSMRQDFLARANDIYDEAQRNQQEIFNIYSDRAKRMGLDPENVVLDYNKGVKREAAPSTSGKVRPMKEFHDAMAKFKGDRKKVREFFLKQGVTEFK